MAKKPPVNLSPGEVLEYPSGSGTYYRGDEKGEPVQISSGTAETPASFEEPQVQQQRLEEIQMEKEKREEERRKERTERIAGKETGEEITIYTEDPNLMQSRILGSFKLREGTGVKAMVQQAPRYPRVLSEQETISTELKEKKAEEEKITREKLTQENFLDVASKRATEILGLDKDAALTDKDYATLASSGFSQFSPAYQKLGRQSARTVVETPFAVINPANIYRTLYFAEDIITKPEARTSFIEQTVREPAVLPTTVAVGFAAPEAIGKGFSLTGRAISKIKGGKAKTVYSDIIPEETMVYSEQAYEGVAIESGFFDKDVLVFNVKAQISEPMTYLKPGQTTLGKPGGVVEENLLTGERQILERAKLGDKLSDIDITGTIKPTPEKTYVANIKVLEQTKAGGIVSQEGLTIRKTGGVYDITGSGTGLREQTAQLQRFKFQEKPYELAIKEAGLSDISKTGDITKQFQAKATKLPKEYGDTYLQFGKEFTQTLPKNIYPETSAYGQTFTEVLRATTKGAKGKGYKSVFGLKGKSIMRGDIPEIKSMFTPPKSSGESLFGLKQGRRSLYQGLSQQQRDLLGASQQVIGKVLGQSAAKRAPIIKKLPRETSLATLPEKTPTVSGLPKLSIRELPKLAIIETSVSPTKSQLKERASYSSLSAQPTQFKDLSTTIKGMTFDIDNAVKQGAASLSISSQTQTTRPRSLLSQKQSAITLPKLSSGLVTTPGTIGKTTKPRFVTLFGFDSDTKRYETQDVYNAYVKDEPYGRGRFIKVTKKPLSREAALNRGFYVADNTISQTVKIKKAGRRRASLMQGDLLGGLSYKFSEGKGKNTFIEKRSFAIDTPGEVRKLRVSRFLKGERRYRRFI